MTFCRERSSKPQSANTSVKSSSLSNKNVNTSSPYISHNSLLQLQRSAGNGAVSQLMTNRCQSNTTRNTSQKQVNGNKNAKQNSLPGTLQTVKVKLSPNKALSSTQSPGNKACIAPIVVQRKSRITSMAPNAVEDSPIETLSKNLKSYYQAAGLLEQYNFHGIGSKTLGDYKSGTYKRAGTVTAEIDPNSKSKVDSKDRDNDVIAPYGHFGVMERSIFKRQDLGNTFDGGHLVEHTLLEGRDADVHGNIAPQENKHFNQGLMRGWESIPEQLMSSTKFNYTVTVSYSDSNFQRTGDQLLQSGVLNKQLETKLIPGDLTKLKTLNITFPRWTPTTWHAAMTPVSGGTQLPLTTVSHMPSHFHNLKNTPEDARKHVIHTPNPTAPHLTRRNSGTLAGAIRATTGGMTTGMSPLFGGTGYQLPQADSFEALMYQPDAMDETEQPKATVTPSGGTPSVIAPVAIPVNILTSPFYIGQLVTEIMKTPGTKNDTNVRKHSPYQKSRSGSGQKRRRQY